MKKITLTLLILLSTQIFAAKNLVHIYVTQNGQLSNACTSNNGLPSQTAVNTEYPLTFTYVSNVDGATTNFKPYFDSDFTVSNSDCETSFGGNNICTITGVYKPTALGNNNFRLFYRWGQNTFYCDGHTQTTQYVGDAIITLDASSTPFAAYYAKPSTVQAVYILKNAGTNVTVINSAEILNNPASWVVNECSGVTLTPDKTCRISFGGSVKAGVYEFSITVNYSGKQYIHNQTIVVGNDKLMGCKIG